MPDNFQFGLGSILRDVITGFEGVVRGRSQYLTGCNTYGLQSREMKDGAPTDWRWFDEHQLEATDKAAISLERPRTKGGPIEVPKNPNEVKF